MSKMIYGIIRTCKDISDTEYLFPVSLRLFNSGYAVKISSDMYDDHVILSRREYEFVLKSIHEYLLENSFDIYKDQGSVPAGYDSNIIPWEMSYDWVTHDIKDIYMTFSIVEDLSKEDE